MPASMRVDRIRRSGRVGLILLALCLGAVPVDAQEGTAMQTLTVILDGQPVPLTPGPRLDRDNVLVPLYTFAEAVGAEAKTLDNNGPLAVCKEDLCIPLNTGEEVTVSINGTLYAPLDAFGEPLGLRWQREDGVLRVTTAGKGEQSGLGMGSRPPEFTLPDLYSGDPVSTSDYRGKKTVFYMWASW